MNDNIYKVKDLGLVTLKDKTSWLIRKGLKQRGILSAKEGTPEAVKFHSWVDSIIEYLLNNHPICAEEREEFIKLKK